MTTDREADGSGIRRLWPSDAGAVRAHFLRLDPETRADRFMAALGDGAVTAYAERAFRSDGLIYGAFVADTLRGVGELRPMRRRLLGQRIGPRAEAAFTVERGHRRHGLGAGLFRRVVGAARNRGVSELHVRCLADNQPMRRLALRLGAELRLAGPETDGTVRLAGATPFSLWSEGLAEAFDYALAFFAPSRVSAGDRRA